MDLKVVAVALAIAVVVSGAGVFILGNHDTAEPESKAAAYSGASLTNYNSNAADNPTEYSDISNIYKGTSGNTMVFQIAELKNCIYTIVGYTGGDGYEKTLSFSDSKTIGSSFEKSTSKTFEYTTSVENSHSEGWSISAGAEFGGSKIIKGIFDLNFSLSVTWSESDATTTINSMTDVSSYSESIGENISKTSSFTKSVMIPTEKGKNYAWAYTTTAYIYELVEFEYDQTIEKYKIHLPVKYAISYDMSKLNDYVFETESGSEFDFKYADEKQCCVLTDKQIFKALESFDGKAPATHTITFYKDSAGNEVYSTMKVVDGCFITVPKDPICPTYEFIGWSDQKNDNKTISMGVATEDTSYYPVYKDLFPGYKRIYTSSDFISIGMNLFGKYVLVNDIVLTDTFTPVGDSDKPFNGELDGNGCSVKYSYGGNPTGVHESGIGLFGVIGERATIKNTTVYATLNMTHNLNSNDYWLGLGGIAGISHGGKIEHCRVYSTINTNEEYGHAIRTCAGAVVGVVTQNTVTIVDTVGRNSISVHGEWTFVGGIIGCSKGGVADITHCYATGTVDGHGNKGRFDTVSHRAAAGGIIGWTESEGRFTIKFCSSDCTVKSDGRYSDSGGLVGQDSVGKGVVSYCCFVQDRMFEYASGDHSPNDAAGYGNVAVSNIASIMNSDAAKAFDHYYCIEYKQKHSCS